MKILLIIENIGSGGAERQMCGLAASLTQRGYSCRLISYERRQFYESYLQEHGVDYKFVPFLLNKRTRVFRLVSYLWHYKPSVVISFNESVNITTCLARLFYPCKLIVSERNNQFKLSAADKIRFNLYRLASFIVPNSTSQGEFIKSNYKNLISKIYPIINFVDINKFHPKVDWSNNENIKIVTTARYTEQKNCLLYLEVVKRAKSMNLPIKFEWYGSFTANPEYFKLFIERYNSLNISDILSVYDQTSDIVEVYKKADVFCLPSLYEGYPNVIIEAMSCKLPIICSNVFENPYIIKDGINGFLFDPRNVDDIIRVLVKITSLSKEERKQIGELNREQCININSIDKFTDNWINLIKS